MFRFIENEFKGFDKRIETYIISVARSYNWASPTEIEKLYYDDLDMYGLIFWYNDAKEMQESIKTK